MAKRRYGLDEDKIQKYINEGRGQGYGSEYKPWLSIHDFPSKGRVSRCKGWKSNRVHHFMSDNETRYFYLLEWSDKVIDIREQFPILDRSETIKIAETLGINYPKDVTTSTPILLTTDFMITFRENGRNYDIARTIKTSTELDNPRVIEKLEIERYYWKSKGIDWGIVTEQEINKSLALNIEWVYPAYLLEDIEEIDKGSLKKYIPILKSRLSSTSDLVQTVLETLDYEYCMQPGVFLYLFKHLIATKQLLVTTFNERLNLSTLITDTLQII
jgi:hypothetical protein